MTAKENPTAEEVTQLRTRLALLDSTVDFLTDKLNSRINFDPKAVTRDRLEVEYWRKLHSVSMYFGVRHIDEIRKLWKENGVDI